MKYLFLIFCFLLISCSNKKSSSSIEKKDYRNQKQVFSQKLTREIRFVLRKKVYSEQNLFLSVVITKSDLYEKGENLCIAILSLSIGIDSLKLTGYTFIDKEPIACYILSPECSQNIIYQENLLIDKEGIKSNFMKKESIADGNYDYPSYVYKISNDSLIRIESPI